MNFPLLSSTSFFGQSTAFLGPSTTYQRLRNQKPLQKLINSIGKKEIIFPQISNFPKQRNPEAVELLNKLSDTQELLAELKKLNPANDIDVRELYSRVMLAPFFLRNNLEKLIQEWIKEALPLTDEWGEQLKLKEKSWDNLLSTLDFKNAFAFLSAGYQQAFLATNEKVSLDARTFFGSRLQSLIYAFPEEYQALELGNPIFNKTSVMKFDKATISNEFLKKLEEQHRHCLQRAKINLWMKNIGISVLSLSGFLIGIYIGKKFFSSIAEVPVISEPLTCKPALSEPVFIEFVPTKTISCEPVLCKPVIQDSPSNLFQIITPCIISASATFAFGYYYGSKKNAVKTIEEKNEEDLNPEFSSTQSLNQATSTLAVREDLKEYADSEQSPTASSITPTALNSQSINQTSNSSKAVSEELEEYLGSEQSPTASSITPTALNSKSINQTSNSSKAVSEELEEYLGSEQSPTASSITPTALNSQSINQTSNSSITACIRIAVLAPTPEDERRIISYLTNNFTEKDKDKNSDENQKPIESTPRTCIKLGILAKTTEGERKIKDLLINFLKQQDNQKKLGNSQTANIATPSFLNSQFENQTPSPASVDIQEILPGTPAYRAMMVEDLSPSSSISKIEKPPQDSPMAYSKKKNKHISHLT